MWRRLACSSHSTWLPVVSVSHQRPYVLIAFPRVCNFHCVCSSVISVCVCVSFSFYCMFNMDFSRANCTHPLQMRHCDKLNVHSAIEIPLSAQTSKRRKTHGRHGQYRKHFDRKLSSFHIPSPFIHFTFIFREAIYHFIELHTPRKSSQRIQ